MSSLCVGSIEYSSRNSLNGEQLLWVRLRVICESDGKTIWNDTFNSIKDVQETLLENDIAVHDIIQVSPDIFVARAKTESMNNLAEWKPGCNPDELYVRTFLTVIDANTNQDIFERDSCWLTTLLGDRPIDIWFQHLKSIVTK
jgi:hypothetical protein